MKPVSSRTIGQWLLVLASVGCMMPPSFAEPADRFPPNPLLEGKVVPSAIAPAKLTQALANLNQQAIAQLQAGNADAAFELWNQQLRLSRNLGPAGEVKALAQVGEVAWTRNNTRQVRYIQQRLQQIQADRQPPLMELAAAYEVIRAPQLALAVYQQGLTAQANDPAAVFQWRNRTAQTQLDWFNYRQAAQVYQDLLTQAQATNNPTNQLAYAYQLAYVQEQARNPQGAIVALERLIERYSGVSDPRFLASFQIRLADQYRRNQQPEAAERTYQAAYRTAEAQQQMGFAGDALRQLAAFYREQQRLDAAIQVYDFLTSFEQEMGRNPFNAMDAYDRLGQIYRTQGNQPQAIAAFSQGLRLAQQLNHRVTYFETQLNSPKPITPPNPIPTAPI